MVWCWDADWEFRRCSPAFDCRTVRQRRLTSSFLLDRLARKPLTLSRTKALAPRHKFLVASFLTQPQTASSALRFGL